jgi:hypothetical protein
MTQSNSCDDAVWSRVKIIPFQPGHQVMSTYIDSRRHKLLADTLTLSIGRIPKYFLDDPAEYHLSMKSVSLPLNIIIVEGFRDDDLAREEYGGIISDFIENIFVENYMALPDNKDHVVRSSSREMIAYSGHFWTGTRIRGVLPQKECYDLISILYDAYQVIGKNDLTDEVTDVIEEWLTDNQPCVKFSNKK